MKHTQHRDTQDRNYIIFLVLVMLAFTALFSHARSRGGSAERALAEIQASMLEEEPSVEITEERQRLGLPIKWTAGDTVLSEMNMRHAESDRDRWSRQASIYHTLGNIFFSLNVLFLILQILFGKNSLCQIRTK